MKHERIPGFFDYPKVYDYIYNHIPHMGKFVEVGCWEGKSAAYMAELIDKGKKFFFMDCVDIWKRFDNGGFEHPHITAADGTIVDVFVNNLRYCGLLKYVNVIQASTFKAVNMYVDNSQDAVFIDNDHSYAHVSRELRVWVKKVKSGGLLVGHDYNLDEDNFGVKRAVEEFKSEYADQIADFELMGSCYIFTLK